MSSHAFLKLNLCKVSLLICVCRCKNTIHHLLEFVLSESVYQRTLSLKTRGFHHASLLEHPVQNFSSFIFLLGRLLRILLIFLQNGFDDIYRNRKKLFVLQQSVARHVCFFHDHIGHVFDLKITRYPQIGTQSSEHVGNFICIQISTIILICTLEQLHSCVHDLSAIESSGSSLSRHFLEMLRSEGQYLLLRTLNAFVRHRSQYLSAQISKYIRKIRRNIQLFCVFARHPLFFSTSFFGERG